MPSTLNPQPSTLSWYAVHTKPRQETVAEQSLQREGIYTFFPKLKRKKTIRRVRKWVVGPLFPSYIFARFNAEISGRLVKYAGGVTNIVSFGGKPARVDEEIIASIKNHSEDGMVVVSPPVLHSGDVVEIQEGPLRGLQGIFEREMSDRERVVILLETLAKGVRVEVSREQLEKIP
jgi:transcriptional antiterminator RfaH